MSAAFAWQIAGALALAIAIIWSVGSFVLAAFRPWRQFQRGDRWLAWLWIVCWPIFGTGIAFELMFECRLDRREARVPRGH
ncbi:MAG: hypothetical protein V4808_07135 [Pseudomonadota bacterium]